MKFWSFCLILASFLSAEAQTFVIKADDLMRFDVSQIDVKAGSEVHVVLEHVGKIPNHAHNFVLLAPGADPARIAKAVKEGPLPESLRDQVLAMTPLARAGQRVEIRFKAPPPGSYTFICAWPGHYALSRGTLTSR